jgi:hypothetical protein
MHEVTTSTRSKHRCIGVMEGPVLVPGTYDTWGDAPLLATHIYYIVYDRSNEDKF